MCPGEKFQEWTTLQALFIISFPFICHSQTALQIIDSPSPVEGILGENVTIPCVLTDKRQPQRVPDLDLSTDSVRWDMKSLDGSIHTVYLFTKGNNKLNIHRCNIEGKEFKRGIASLTVYNVQGSDEGEYICNVYVAGNKLTAVRTVEVSARPVVTLSSYDVTIELGNEQSVKCYVHKFYPEYVKIRWEKRSASSERSDLYRETTGVPTEAEDGTFSVTSLMSVKPSSIHEDGDKYFCIVSHRSLKSESAAYFTITVKEPSGSYNLFLAISIVISVLLVVGNTVAVYYIQFKKRPPKISVIAGIDDLVHGKSSTLSWTVLDFKPKSIEINAYLERSNKKQMIRSWKYPSPQSPNYKGVGGEIGEDFRLLKQQNAMQSLTPQSLFFSYSCLCSINITPDKQKDKQAELVIEVIHNALKYTLTERHTLYIKGDFFTSQIIAPRCLKHGEEVTLTCDITKCDPGPLSITWLKGKEVLYKDGKIQYPRYSYSETPEEPYEGNVLKSSSSLTFRVQVKEDHGVKYICRVDYTEINQILTPQLETYVTAQPVVEQITSKHVGQQMKLSCRIHSFHPRTIDIRWFKEDEELPTTKGELSIGEDDLYSTTSILMYTPELKDIGKTLRCKVDHQSLQNPETREWKMKEQRLLGHGIGWGNM